MKCPFYMHIVFILYFNYSNSILKLFDAKCKYITRSHWGHITTRYHDTIRCTYNVLLNLNWSHIYNLTSHFLASCTVGTAFKETRIYGLWFRGVPKQQGSNIHVGVVWLAFCKIKALHRQLLAIACSSWPLIL